MKKLWGIIVIAMSMNGAVQAIEPVEEWSHIMGAAKTLVTDPEMKRSIEEMMNAIQKTLSLGIKKINHKISSDEKEKVVLLVNILKRIIDKYEAVIKAGSLDDVSVKTKDEINQLGQELMILVMPLLFLMQNQSLMQDGAGSDDQFFQTIRLQAYNGVKRTMTQLDKELQ